MCPTPLLVAEFGGLPLFGSLPVDIDGDGEEVEECMPLVWIPGGMGRFALVDESDEVDVAEGAMSLCAHLTSSVVYHSRLFLCSLLAYA
jgi:hypothetical protein